MLTLTSAAANRVKALQVKKGDASLKLRLEVLGGGCAGYQYKFGFAETVEQDDTIFSHDEAHLVVDATSLQLLEGAVVDFEEKMIGASFVVKNPNASSGCGCGTSFAV